MNEDKRKILDRTSYLVKKKQGGYKIESNYNPLQFAADYVLAQDKSRSIKTKGAFGVEDGIEKHQHDYKPIEVTPLSLYEEEDEYGEVYLTIENLFALNDTYFNKDDLNDIDTKDVVALMEKYNIPVDNNAVTYLLLLGQGKSARCIEEITGLSEKKQRTIKNNIYNIVTRRKIIEPVSEVNKACKHCGETKSLTDFAKDHRNKDGRKNICKTCDCKRKTTKITGNRAKTA